MKIEPNGYVANVEFGPHRACVFCITYFLAPSKQHVGVEFRQIFETSDERFGIPSDRTATFQEELRTLNEAAGIAPDRESEVLYVQQKMYEAYGNAAKVHVRQMARDAT